MMQLGFNSMPVYTYQCADCGVRFDARQKFSDEPLVECPECGGQLHRVPQPVGIVFRGSGWYAKDSRGQSTLAPPAKKEGDSETKTAKPAESAAGSTSSASAETPQSSKAE
jgi:putative FmdB family regulatory protein